MLKNIEVKVLSFAKILDIFLIQFLQMAQMKEMKISAFFLQKLRTMRKPIINLHRVPKNGVATSSFASQKFIKLEYYSPALHAGYIFLKCDFGFRTSCCTVSKCLILEVR